MPTSESASKSIYQLKISLEDITPQIWRRVLVPSEIPLSKLHVIIQIAMGWTNSHLHEFLVGEQRYSDPAFELDGFDEVFDEDKAKLCEVVPALKSILRYHYDFGDGWMHKVVVEKQLAADPSQRYPHCTGGARACPPEDCGGIPGYYRLHELLSDKRHPEHVKMREWLAGPFDAGVFDLNGVNRELERYFSRKPRANRQHRGEIAREHDADS